MSSKSPFRISIPPRIPTNRDTKKTCCCGYFFVSSTTAASVLSFFRQVISSFFYLHLLAVLLIWVLLPRSWCKLRKHEQLNNSVVFEDQFTLEINKCYWDTSEKKVDDEKTAPRLSTVLPISAPPSNRNFI